MERRRPVRAWFFVPMVLLCGLAANASAVVLTGTFSLQRGAAKTAGVATVAPIAGRPLARNLAFFLAATGSRRPLVRYDVDMTKLIHVIIVSDDLATFAHVHPVLGRDGRFRIVQSFPRPAVYHVYADAEPHGFGQQVFRFDVPVGVGVDPAPRAVRDVRPTGATATLPQNTDEACIESQLLPWSSPSSQYPLSKARAI